MTHLLAILRRLPFLADGQLPGNSRRIKRKAQSNRGKLARALVTLHFILKHIE
jgi:hypothetical protein